jgi:formylglycine-generating enzyme required for sulfatase activity
LAAVAAAASAAQPAVKFGPWHTTGSLPAKGFSDPLFPEKGIDVKAKGPNGKPLWVAQPSWRDGMVQSLTTGSTPAATYLFRTVTAAKAARLPAGFGSDDGLEVWLNGKKLLSKNVPRGVTANEDQLTLDLQQGENQLLLKIFNLQGDHGFYFAAGRNMSAAARNAPTATIVNSLASTKMALEDLVATFGAKFARGQELLRKLEDLEKQLAEAEAAVARGDSLAKETVTALNAKLTAFQSEALLANPLLDFDKLLLVKRTTGRLGLPQNWQANPSVGGTGYDNEIAVLSPIGPQGKLTTFYKPGKNEFVGDVDLHFNADRMLFSMPGGKTNRWQVWEIKADGSGLRQVTPGEEPDVDNFDACYLPDGRIIFSSTRCFHGVPCVGGGDPVANLFIINADGTGTRQLTFDQDQNWCPTVLNNGRVLYTRWEYSDSPHYFTRLLFHMNPDGTGQAEYYASNSYWPNSTFYARPIPGHPTKVVGVISGHHGVPRMGELIVFDPAVGRHEASGAVQRIPGYGKPVAPIIADGLVDGSWPKFLHPYPLSDKYFLVSAQPTAQSKWGIYLVDIFDNMTLVREEPGYVLFEPVPLKKAPTPPVIPDRINLAKQDATIYLSDVYTGPGLQGVPRGTVKKLRVYEVHYGYNGMGGHIHIGIDGPWDVHRILGTVPVEADGSAKFTVPANTPVAVQPLDAEGKAVQIMRSWYTAMPGESASCVGCHETQNSTPAAKHTVATLRPASPIAPWYGPARGFSFKREVQPVLDKYCVGCHNETAKPENGRPVPDLTAKKQNGPRGFTPSYLALHPYVRRPGPESDYHLQKPLEYHADTSPLVQMLNRGHYNVKLDAEAWDRLVTWIDLNVPDHGTWTEHAGKRPIMARRLEMRTKYANRPEDPEEIPVIEREPAKFVTPEPVKAKPQAVACPGWPFDAVEAARRQAAVGLPPKLKIDLDGVQSLELVLVPPGEFVIGDPLGEVDEWPLARVKIDKPFYMATTEITNGQYAMFDPDHKSGVISVFNKDQSNRGEPADRDRQPAIRVTWQEAMSFCRWLSERTGQKYTLPTEAQWEYACRAGTATPMSWGGCDVDFGKLANLADQRVLGLCRGDSPKWIPSAASVNDGAVVSDSVGRYPANPWGLQDMHGNVAEWTLTSYRAYPYNENDGRSDPYSPEMKVARGGSWYDRPFYARSASRVPHRPWQSVYNVGFRVVLLPQ